METRTRKFVWVLTIKDGVENQTYKSVYADEILARRSMHLDIVDTIARYNIDDGLPISSTDTKIQFADLSWEIEKCGFYDGKNNRGTSVRGTK